MRYRISPDHLSRGRGSPASNLRRRRDASVGWFSMTRSYGWTGQLRHGLWECKCGHWNYYRTITLRIDSNCNAQGCSYRARVVLDRSERSGGRPRQVIVKEYPHYRPPRTVKQEQYARNVHRRRSREIGERLAIKKDRGVFMTAGDLQEAQDRADLERHGGVFRLEHRPDLKRHPDLGGSRMKLIRDELFILQLKETWANKGENDPQDPPSKH